MCYTFIKWDTTVHYGCLKLSSIWCPKCEWTADFWLDGKFANVNRLEWREKERWRRHCHKGIIKKRYSMSNRCFFLFHLHLTLEGHLQQKWSTKMDRQSFLSSSSFQSSFLSKLLLWSMKISWPFSLFLYPLFFIYENPIELPWSQTLMRLVHLFGKFDRPSLMNNGETRCIPLLSTLDFCFSLPSNSCLWHKVEAE